MHARRSLRASFVVTLASSALVGVGCGSTVVQVPTPQGDAGADVDVGTDAELPRPDLGNPPPDLPDATPASCPPTVPSGACDPSLSRTCSYGDCLGRPTTEARCVGGMWEVVVSTCNPPPPDAGPPPCPTAAPPTGAACDAEGQTCTWGTCPPSSVSFGMCSGGRWVVGISSCNPPIDAGPPPDA